MSQLHHIYDTNATQKAPPNPPLTKWAFGGYIVNTIFAGAPFGAPSQQYNENNIVPGIWNIMPVFYGDHMSLQGGMTKRVNVRPFCMDLLSTIDSLT